LKGTISVNSKQHYALVYEQADGTALYCDLRFCEGVWLIKANQGHSLKIVGLELKLIPSVLDIPSGLVVCGTTGGAWVAIQGEGPSRMKWNLNHIYLAQDAGGNNVISSMFLFSLQQLLFHCKYLYKFYLSNDGVVLAKGDKTGYLKTKFFD
ncbi:hypothetical protein P691DRAFT_684840, partial [Macrolepiota fuliginosa MF-IS2]